MSRNKNSILAAAVIGALYATGAAAQVNITTGSAPVRYAAEIIKPSILAEVAANQLSFSLGYNFSDNEVRYARFECTSNLVFLSPEVDAASSANAVYGSLNGTNTSALFFSITDAAAPGSQAVSNSVVIIGASVTANAYRLTDNADVVCTYSLYDQPSQAQAGGTAGRIFTISNPFLRSVASYSFVTTPGQAIADVEAANGSFFSFTPATPGGITDREIGAFTIALTSPNTPLTPAGITITAADLFAANTGVVVAGDFSALSNVFHSGTVDCVGGNVFNGSVFASNAASVRENTGAAFYSAVPVCVIERGNVAIPASAYSILFDAVAAFPLIYNTPDIGPLALGEIIRNGTSLQAPLVQIPAGFLSRINLTNTGSIVRNFTWTFRPASGGSANEASTAFTGTSSGTGTVPANGSLVISLVDALGPLANFGGTPPRGFFTVNVAAPNNQIQGLYQIVNPGTGAISNHVMVRPGTN